MHHVFHRRLAYCCLIVATGFIIVALHRSTESSHSATIFSNMPSKNDHVELIMAGQDVVVEFDVPSERNFLVNSVQASLTNNQLETQTITASIHADGGDAPGDVVVDLGEQIVPAGSYTITFIPLAEGQLSGGDRYWLVLSNAGSAVEWWSADAPNTPKGIFTFVDNGLLQDGKFTSQTAFNYNVSIDADPIED